jgi:hypothetical protein
MKIVLISMDKEVRGILESRDVPFTLVYPDKSMKSEIVRRLIERGNNEKFIELIESNFNN